MWYAYLQGNASTLIVVEFLGITSLVNLWNNKNNSCVFNRILDNTE